jgi:hypothetical protein
MRKVMYHCEQCNGTTEDIYVDGWIHIDALNITQGKGRKQDNTAMGINSIKLGAGSCRDFCCIGHFYDFLEKNLSRMQVVKPKEEDIKT